MELFRFGDWSSPRNKLNPSIFMHQDNFIQKDVKDNYGSGSAIPRIILKRFQTNES